MIIKSAFQFKRSILLIYFDNYCKICPIGTNEENVQLELNAYFLTRYKIN